MSRRRPPRARRGQCKPVGYGTAAAASELAATSGTGRSRYRAAERAGDRRIRVVPRSYFRPCSRKRAGAFFRFGRWDLQYTPISRTGDPRCGRFAALADGLHISRFFLNLEKELADMTRQWNESK